MILPNEMVKQILSYNSHPTADMIRALIVKYQEVIIMRLKNARCTHLSFFETWRHIELDQGKIDKWRQCLLNCRYDYVDFDF